MAKEADAPVYYGEVGWSPEDVMTLAPTLSREEAEGWLNRNEKYIRDRMTELGWGVIETFLSFDGIPLEGQD